MHELELDPSELILGHFLYDNRMGCSMMHHYSGSRRQGTEDG